MTEPTQTKTDGNGLLRWYLLGQLSGEDLETVEVRLFTDECFLDELAVAEDELIDAYLSDELNPQERSRFMSYFLKTEERKEKVRFAIALRSYIDEARPASPAQRAPEVLAGRARSWNPFGIIFPARRGLAFGLAAACVVILALSVAYIGWFKGRVSPSRPAESARKEGPARTEAGAPQTIRPALSVTLSTGGSRGSGREEGEWQRIAPQPDSSVVEFSLPMRSDVADGLTVALVSDQDRELLRTDQVRKEIRGGVNFAVVVIEGRYLKTGDYQFRLYAGAITGNERHLGTYPLRVSR